MMTNLLHGAHVANKLFSTIARLRLLLVMFLTLTVSANVWGADVTISVSSDPWNHTGISGDGGTTEVSKNGVTVSSNDGYKDGTTAIREYSGGDITVSSNDNITKIVFTSTAKKGSKYGPDCIALKSGSAGTYTTSSNSNLGTWTGTAKSITFTCSAQFRWTQVVVTTASSHTVTWTINPAAGGSLSPTSGTSTTVTPNVAYTYGSPAYTVTPAGKATVSQDGDNFTATPSANCTIQINMVEKPKYTVTLNAGPGTCAASVTEASAGAGVTLPTPTLDCGDWEFAGWKTTSAVTTETTTEPTLIPAGAYSPTSDITLYAVYQRTETIQGGGSGNYELITSAPSDWSGTYLIVDGSSKNCFNGSLTSPDAGGNYTSVTISDNTITSNTTTDSYSVTISKSTTNGQYYIKTASGYYIGSTASTSSDGNELKSSTSTKYDNSISISSNNVTIKGPDHILKFFYQSGQSWRFRFYKSTTTQNVRLPQLYKKSSGSSTTTYYHSTPDCGITQPTYYLLRK